MKVFSGILPNSGHAAVQSAFRAILGRASAKELAGSPWSLAELELDDEDYEWLRAWARQLDGPTARFWLRPEAKPQAVGTDQSCRVSIGALLLLLAAECTRRSLPQESRWAVAQPSSFGADAQGYLFSEGDPSTLHLNVIRGAVKRLSLRHTYLRQDLECHNESVTLQIGLTSTDIERRLRRWLNGEKLPTALETLADEATGSESFREFWRGCQDFRTGALTRGQFHRLLAASPWVLPEWIEQIARHVGALVIRRRVVVKDGSAQAAAATPAFLPADSLTVFSPADSLAVFSPADSVTVSPADSLTVGRQTRELGGALTRSRDLFGKIEPDGDWRTIAGAVRALVRRAERDKLRRAPWSLAELQPTDFDFIWLRIWIKQLTAETLAFCCEPWRRFEVGGQEYSFLAGLGSLLLFWLAETARRTATESVLWRSLTGGCAPEVERLLFTQGQPTWLLREMVETAARCLNLRHVFGAEGERQWPDTIYLQCGFTRRGFLGCLPEWLTGGARAASLQLLLDEECGSASFRGLWEALRGFRQDNVSEEQLRALLKTSPWVLDEWADELLATAKSRLYLRRNTLLDDAPSFRSMLDALVNPNSNGSAVAAAEQETRRLSFLDKPVLHWPPLHEPYFVVRTANLSHFDLAEEFYTLSLADQPQAQLLRQPEGHYQVLQEQEIVVPLTSPVIEATLAGCSGEVAAVTSVELWPVEEEVTVFDLTAGRRLPDAWLLPMDHESSYAVLLAQGLTMTPPPVKERLVGRQGAKLCLLTADWPPETRVLCAEHLLWEPYVRGKTMIVDPFWARDVKISLVQNEAVWWGKKLWVAITHPANVVVQYARCRGRSLPLEVDTAGRTLAGPLTMQPSEHGTRLRLHLSVRRGDEVKRMHREVDTGATGVACLTAKGWRVLDPDSVLTLEQAKTNLFTFSPPSEWNYQTVEIGEWALMEGNTWLRRLRKQPAPINPLAGLGAPLTVRYGPYAGDIAELHIAGSVIDTGIIKDAELVEEPDAPQTLRLKLSRSSAPAEGDAIIWWDLTGRVELIKPQRCQRNSGEWWWAGAAPEHLADYLAVAVLSDGQRLGAWWGQEPYWAESLADAAQHNPLQSAALMRWFRLPLLSNELKPVVGALLQQFPEEFAAAWLANKGLPPELQGEELSEGWLAALRELYRDWWPETATACRILLQLAGAAADDDLPERLPGLIWRISAIDPLLLGKLLKAWVDERPYTNLPAVLTKLRWQLVGCADEEAYHQHKQQLLESSAETMQLDPEAIYEGLVEKGLTALLNPPGELNECDQALAVAVQPLRQLFTLSLLEMLESAVCNKDPNRSISSSVA